MFRQGLEHVLLGHIDCIDRRAGAARPQHPEFLQAIQEGRQKPAEPEDATAVRNARRRPAFCPFLGRPSAADEQERDEDGGYENGGGRKLHRRIAERHDAAAGRREDQTA